MLLCCLLPSAVSCASALSLLPVVRRRAGCQSSAVQYNAVQCNAAQYSTVQYNAVQDRAIEYNAAPRCTSGLYMGGMPLCCQFFW